jgi:hypothetical protein
MNIKELYNLVENLECSIVNNLDTQKDQENLINYLLKNNNMVDARKTLLIDYINDFISKTNTDKENHNKVVESAKKCFKLMKLILESKDFDYDILKKYNIDAISEDEKYEALEYIIKNKENE